ncbi:DUF6193 family natural product biosynthesis protein [Kitasatospora sp. NPDC004240]
MSANTDPAVLYPDVAAHGGLGAALRAAAEAGGLTVPVESSESQPLGGATVMSPLAHRRPLSISSWAAERRWSIRGEESFQGMALVEGSTDDLAQLARAAHAWHEGAALEDIPRAAPFVRLTGRFEVPDQDLARLTESEWHHLRIEAEEQGAAYRALIEAAYAEPVLRGLFPFTSHWVLRFSTSTRPFMTAVGPCLFASGVDRYRVCDDILGEHVLDVATTPEKAVAAALHHLPARLGPITSGAVRPKSG